MDDLTLFRENGSQDSGVKTNGNEFWRMLSFFPSKTHYLVLILLAVASGASPVIMLIYFGDFATIASGTDFMDSINKVCLKLLYVVIATTVINISAYMMRSVCNPMFKFELRKKLFSNLLDQAMSFFDKTSTGVLVSRISEDITLIQRTYFEQIFEVTVNVSMSLTSIIISFVLSWEITLVALCVVPLIFIAFYISNCFVEKGWKAFNEKSTNTASKAEEVITQFRTVKSFDCEMKEYNDYHAGIYAVHDIFKTASIAHGIKNGFTSAFEYLTITGVSYYCSHLIVNGTGKLEIGDFMTIINCLMFAIMGFTQISSFFDDLKRAGVAAAKVLTLIDTVPETNRKEGKSLDKITGKIEFQDVGFKYASRNDWAVRNLSFTINPGETVAFVGESGCGKTTTLALIQKFYEIQEGKILFDGVDAKTLSQEYLRSQIAIVPQAPVLFSMSVADNIRYSNPDASGDDVNKAAEVGNAHDFIMALKENYETEVEQNSLSGGQKQRICISRAVLANAPILLLDEATAALDTESEQKVQESIERFRKGKTAIIVAHRLATVINADKIFVFKNGKIIETGTHKELVEKGGEYADLIKFQLQ